MQLYLHRGGQQFGPYSVEQARGYLASGELLADDLAWHEGAANWAPLAQVMEEFPPPPPPPQPVAVPEPVPTEQEQPRTWIPPRRGDAPWSPVAVSAPVPVNILANAAASRAAAAPLSPANPDVASGKVKRSSRKRSSYIDGFKQQQRAKGAQSMVIGAIFFIGGTAVTYFSYEAAATGAGGGVYFVTWGLILFGGVQFLKGLIQFCKA